MRLPVEFTTQPRPLTRGYRGWEGIWCSPRPVSGYRGEAPQKQSTFQRCKRISQQRSSAKSSEIPHSSPHSSLKLTKLTILKPTPHHHSRCTLTIGVPLPLASLNPYLWSQPPFPSNSAITSPQDRPNIKAAFGWV